MIRKPTYLILPDFFFPVCLCWFKTSNSSIHSCMPSTPSMAPDPLNNASNSSYMLLRVLFFRLVLGLQVESSLSGEIISFWLWLQQGNGQVGYLRHIYSLGDNHFRAIVSSAKRFLEVLHFAFGGSEAVIRWHTCAKKPMDSPGLIGFLLQAR